MKRQQSVWDLMVGLVILAALAVVAVIVSATYIADLAFQLGWTDNRRWLAVACIDVLALYAVREWLSRDRPPEVRRAAKRIGWTMLAVSVLCNLAIHLLNAPADQAWYMTGLAIILGALPPVVLFLAVHLFALSSGIYRERVKKPAAAPAQVTAPAAAPSAARAVGASTKPKATSNGHTTVSAAKTTKAVAAAPSTEQVDRARKVWDEHVAAHGKPITRAELRRVLGCNNGVATVLHRTLRQTVDERSNIG